MTSKPLNANFPRPTANDPPRWRQYPYMLRADRKPIASLPRDVAGSLKAFCRLTREIHHPMAPPKPIPFDISPAFNPLDTPQNLLTRRSRHPQSSPTRRPRQ